MAQWVQVIAAKTNGDLSVTGGTYTVEGEQRAGDMCAGHTCSCAHIHSL